MIDEKLYNKLLAKSLEWGENWRKPLQEICYEDIKNLSNDEQEEITKYIENDVRDNILGFIYKEYEKSHSNSEYKIIDFKEYIKTNYNWIDEQNTKQLISQGSYYAWKEGLIKEDKSLIIFFITALVIIICIVFICFVFFSIYQDILNG